MKKTLKEIAQIVNGELEGSPEIEIHGVATLAEAKPGEITFATGAKYAKALEATKASAAIVPKDLENKKLSLIRVEKPYLALARLLSLFYVKPYSPRGVHPGAMIGNNVKLGEELSIYPLAFISDGAEIGNRVTIFPFAFIGENVKIDKDSVVYPNVTIHHDVTIGKRAILHAGSVIGSDGFGFAHDNGRHVKIPQVGTVIIEDDVEIGANTTIDRATMDATRLMCGAKLDNLVQIAHNVVVGENSAFAAQVGISGSTKVGKNVMLAGQVGVGGHLKIGDGAMVYGQTGVIGDLPPNSSVWGAAANPINVEKKAAVVYPKLPEMLKRIKELEKRVEELESR